MRSCNIALVGCTEISNEYRPIRGSKGHSTVGILTITEVEFAAACDVFDVHAQIEDTAYHAQAASADGYYPAVLRRAPDRANTAASGAIREMIEDFFPLFIFLVGTAGGVFERHKKHGREHTQLGDVVVADFIEYVEFAKIVNNEISYRKQAHDHPSIYLRAQIADPIIAAGSWSDELQGIYPGCEHDEARVSPIARVGNIASGEKVFSDDKHHYQKSVTKHFSKAVAFEMESFGVARAIFEARRNVNYSPHLLVVRGISDFTNVKSSEKDRVDWSPFAARSALVFARSVVDKVLGRWVPFKSGEANGNV